MSPRLRSTLSGLQREVRALRQQLASRDQELGDALESAAHIQRSMIPSNPPVYSNLHYARGFVPFKKVGGDLFNIAPLDAEYPFERFDEFFTSSYLLLKSQTGQVRYGNAGHPPPPGEARLVADLHAQADHALDRACQRALAAQRRFAGEVPAQDDVTLIGIEFSCREPAGLAT